MIANVSLQVTIVFFNVLAFGGGATGKLPAHTLLLFVALNIFDKKFKKVGYKWL